MKLSSRVCLKSVLRINRHEIKEELCKDKLELHAI